SSIGPTATSRIVVNNRPRKGRVYGQKRRNIVTGPAGGALPTFGPDTVDAETLRVSLADPVTESLSASIDTPSTPVGHRGCRAFRWTHPAGPLGVGPPYR